MGMQHATPLPVLSGQWSLVPCLVYRGGITPSYLILRIATSVMMYSFLGDDRQERQQADQLWLLTRTTRNLEEEPVL
jgi:hypothetical protein